MAEDTIEIEYQLTVDDYAQFSADANVAIREKTSVKLSAWHVLTCMFLGIVIVIAIQFIVNVLTEGCIFTANVDPQEAKSPYSFLITMGMFLIIMLCLSCKSSRFIRGMYYKQAHHMISSGNNKAWLSPSILKLSKIQISNISSYVHNNYKWNGVEKIIMQSGGLCIFLSAITAIYVPARFFKSEQELNEIYQKCQQWFSEANKEDQNGA